MKDVIINIKSELINIICSRALEWSAIVTFKNNLIAKNSWIIVILLPIYFRFIDAINKIDNSTDYYFKTLNEIFIIHYSLPFSYKAMYIAATVFTILHFAAIIFAPKMIQEHQNAAEFKKAGKNQQYIMYYMLSHYKTNVNLIEKLKNIGYTINNSKEYDIERYLHNQELDTLYWNCYHSINSDNLIIRIVFTIFIYVGALFWGYVFINTLHSMIIIMIKY